MAARRKTFRPALFTDFFGGEPDWSAWPIGLWALALGVHYLFYKTRNVNERWANERAADLHSKSYDASHIDDIAARYDGKKPERPDNPS